MPLFDPISRIYGITHFRPVDFDYQVYIRGSDYTHLTGNSSHVGLSLSMIIVSESGMHNLANSFARFQRPWWVEWPSHLL